MRAGLEERLTKLRSKAAERWGNDPLQSALREWADADEAMESREYTEAEAHLSAVQKDIETLEQRAPVVLAEQLKVGDTAIVEGNSADAKSAYELAKQIDPNNARALHGLKRAETLDQVLALLITAERAEKDGNLNGAIGQFRQALALDNETTRASEGVSRIEAHLANDAFASAMARGYSALAAKNYDGARSAFEAARKIRPSAAEVDQGIKQIEQEQRTRSIEAKLAQAAQDESQEHWGDALKLYREVHDLDSTVAAANEGIARTEPRAALHEQLQLYLTQPERMFSQPVRMAAKETLAQASRIENPGPVLQQQVAQLRDWLVRADAPVAVALESDNQTQVTIYRVGQLGTFTQRQLQLTPGRYTVVGTRPGYRDVRREIAVTPMASLEPIVIRCEDRI
jgi:tetratricopeptide (TPR) repeat protein